MFSDRDTFHLSLSKPCCCRADQSVQDASFLLFCGERRKSIPSGMDSESFHQDMGAASASNYHSFGMAAANNYHSFGMAVAYESQDFDKDEDKDDLVQMYNMYESHFRIVLLGTPWVGKSAAGNVILGKREFMHEVSTSHVMKKTEHRQTTIAGIKITVVDTPGFLDPHLTYGEFYTELIKCISLCFPGPHVFLIVLQEGQYKEKERDAIGKIMQIFGNKVCDHSMILFTRNPQRKHLDDSLEESGRELAKLKEMCGNRYHTLKMNDLKERGQVRELLSKIEEMIRGDMENYYRNETYLPLEQKIQLKEIEISKLYKEKQGQMTQKYTLNLKKTMYLKESKEKQIEAYYKEKFNRQKELLEFQYMMENKKKQDEVENEFQEREKKLIKSMEEEKKEWQKKEAELAKSFEEKLEKMKSKYRGKFEQDQLWKENLERNFKEEYHIKMKELKQDLQDKAQKLQLEFGERQNQTAEEMRQLKEKLISTEEKLKHELRDNERKNMEKLEKDNEKWRKQVEQIKEKHKQEKLQLDKEWKEKYDNEIKMAEVVLRKEMAKKQHKNKNQMKKKLEQEQRKRFKKMKAQQEIKLAKLKEELEELRKTTQAVQWAWKKDQNSKEATIDEKHLDKHSKKGKTTMTEQVFQHDNIRKETNCELKENECIQGTWSDLAAGINKLEPCSVYKEKQNTNEQEEKTEFQKRKSQNTINIKKEEDLNECEFEMKSHFKEEQEVKKGTTNQYLLKPFYDENCEQNKTKDMLHEEDGGIEPDQFPMSERFNPFHQSYSDTTFTKFNTTNSNETENQDTFMDDATTIYDTEDTMMEDVKNRIKGLKLLLKKKAQVLLQFGNSIDEKCHELKQAHEIQLEQLEKDMKLNMERELGKKEQELRQALDARLHQMEETIKQKKDEELLSIKQDLEKNFKQEVERKVKHLQENLLNKTIRKVNELQLNIKDGLEQTLEHEI
ncbi:golgin subfamily A member 6-like protein 6 [Polypterus senegalus]|uniref:golgin subfamily A member 6-like protein 6 n=1 Tax=Polypterus senegalus TaxID=55291 RepID=UPI001964B6A4|nr:golgin subfamily A member 6-like protein 6 [Polypterus senegalus]